MIPVVSFRTDLERGSVQTMNILTATLVLALLYSVSACKDEYAIECAQQEADCFNTDRGIRETMHRMCPVTCNTCVPSTETACKDEYVVTCGQQKADCTSADGEIRDTMHRMCPVTCNTCDKSISDASKSPVPTSEAACKDKFAVECPQQKASCTSEDLQIRETMHRLCPDTCNMCVKTASSAAPGTTAASFQRTQPTAEKGSKLSSWSDWSKCSPLSCENEVRTRFRHCVYDDGRQAPPSFCSSPKNQTEQCPCTRDTPKQIGTVSQEKCKDNSPLCETFSNLCDSSPIFKENLCIKTCGQCPTDPPFQEPSNKKGDCTDKYDSCEHDEIKKKCKDPNHIQELMAYCPLTCGFCTNQKARTDNQTDSSCHNDIDDQICWKYRKLCFQESSDWKIFCRQTCQTCGGNPGPIVPTRTVQSGLKTVSATTIKATTSSPQTQMPITTRSNCKDQILECPLHKDLCSVPSSGWSNACRVTCNTCST